MMRTKRIPATGLIAALLALTMLIPIGGFAGSAWAQSAQPAASANPGTQIPQPSDGSVNWEGAGWGAATLASNVVYIPAKLVYGVLGGLVGGASWALTGGNTQTANTIWRSSLGGDYVVTPDMLQGKQAVHFSGPTATAPQSGAVQPLNQGSSASAGVSSGTSGLGVTGSPSASVAPAGGMSASASATASTGSGSSYAASQPIDHGSGPVGGTPASAPSPLPSTSIE